MCLGQSQVTFSSSSSLCHYSPYPLPGNKDFSWDSAPVYKKERTFRLAPFTFESSFPLLVLDFDVEAVFSFGLTVKKPSIRPCCFELTAFVSFSHDLRTRSSLSTRTVRSRRGEMTMMAYMNPFSRTRKSTNPSTSGSFHSSFNAPQNRFGRTVRTYTHVNLFCGGNIGVLEEFLRILPWPFFGYLHAAPFLLPILSISVLFGSGPTFLV